MRPVLTLVLVPLVAAKSLCAQGVQLLAQPDTIASLNRPSVQYELVKGTFESTYVTALSGWGRRTDNLFFEANVAPHFSFAWRHGAVVGTPKILLRMYDAYSAPVRRPSYMPRLNLYLWATPRDTEGARGFPFFQATIWSHHSNGQDGEFYDSVTSRINARDGSFSLNYVEISGGWIRVDTNRRAYGTARLGIRANLPINEAEPLRYSNEDRYGTYRMIASGSGSAARSWLAANIAWEAQYIVDSHFQHNPFLSTNRLNVAASLVYAPEVVQNAGVLLNFYWGQDYYNISYKQRFWAVRAGVAFNATSTFLTPR